MLSGLCHATYPRTGNEVGSVKGVTSRERMSKSKLTAPAHARESQRGTDYQQQHAQHLEDEVGQRREQHAEHP